MKRESKRNYAGWLKQFLTGTVVLLIAFYWWQSIRGLDLGRHLLQVQGNKTLVGLALACAWLYLLGHAIVWRTINADLLLSIPWLQALRAWMLSNVARYLPGSLWHFVGRVYLAQQAGSSRTLGTLVVLLEQSLQLLAALLLVTLSLPLWPPESPVRAQAGLLLLVPLGLFAVHPRFFFPLLNALLKRLGRDPVPAMLSYQQMLGYLVAYLVIHLSNGLVLYFLVLALGASYEVAPAVVGGALVAWTLGYISVLTPGGLGLREAVVTAVLGPVIGIEVAAVGALLWRAANLLSELLSALLFELLWRAESPG